MNDILTKEMLDSFAGEFARDRSAAVARRAVMKSGLAASAEEQSKSARNPMVFSIEIKTGAVTNQKKSGRCWLFAARCV